MALQATSYFLVSLSSKPLFSLLPLVYLSFFLFYSCDSLTSLYDFYFLSFFFTMASWCRFADFSFLFVFVVVLWWWVYFTDFSSLPSPLQWCCSGGFVVVRFQIESVLEDLGFVVGWLWRFMGFGYVGFILNHWFWVWLILI